MHKRLSEFKDWGEVNDFIYSAKKYYIQTPDYNIDQNDLSCMEDKTVSTGISDNIFIRTKHGSSFVVNSYYVVICTGTERKKLKLKDLLNG